MTTNRLNSCADGHCTTALGPRDAGRPVQGAWPALVASVDAGLGLVVDILLTWQQRRADRLRLMSFDDHILRDIGISRADVEAEATKPFWRP